MQITERDLEIIGFVLAMKFASVGDIHRKFFKIKRDGSFSNSEWCTRERLRQLIEMGYLNSVRYRFEQKSYYVGTKHGYDLIHYSAAALTPPKPIRQIDIRTFDHDLLVLKSRLVLEEFEKVKNWESDRQLKIQYTEYFQFRSCRDSTPDGVYWTSDGKRVAFEYEIARKSTQRYRDKIRKYVSRIRHEGVNEGPKYDHVRMVCERESVFRILKEQTKIYSQFFTIQLASDFFAPMDRDPDQFH